MGACDARPDRKVRIAGSLPPLAESYRPDRVGPFDENVKHYKTIARSIAPFVDVLVAETMSTADEARAAVTAAAETGLPIWVSWTLDENVPVLRSGESLENAFNAVSEVVGANLEACLFNCTSPEICTVAMPMLRKLAPNLKIGAYANGFVTAASGSGEYRDLSPKEYYEEFASKWVDSGATIVGGCCGIFPPHIEELEERIHKRRPAEASAPKIPPDEYVRRSRTLAPSAVAALGGLCSSSYNSACGCGCHREQVASRL